MGLGLALRAFFKAFKEPEQAKKFVDGTSEAPKKIAEPVEQSHLRLLGILQQSGRLIDFLKEDITRFTDAQVGAAVRKIHADCGKSLEDLVTIRPVMEEGEGSSVKVPQGYDPSTIKIVGKVKGEPPFNGILVHKGWKAHKRSLPKMVGERTTEVIFPAEVEIR